MIAAGRTPVTQESDLEGICQVAAMHGRMVRIRERLVGLADEYADRYAEYSVAMAEYQKGQAFQREPEAILSSHEGHKRGGHVCGRRSP
jgi:hypothetical protein